MSELARHIARRDYERVLLTETLPHETPIIFSNEGIYDRLVSASSLDPVESALVERLLTGVESSRQSVPHLYKVAKNSTEVRRLALLHPRAQVQVREFYRKYENLILYHCSHSPASIRAPQKIAGTYFRRNSWENMHQFRDDVVSLTEVDEVAKHSPSFFAYRGFDRLYKFFDSVDYFQLEKRFTILRTLDVAKCFDSIYTHTLSWALKDKQFTKDHVKVTSTFAQEFDALMQRGNHNETNGIVIGPEVSRIFAEILFQEIDAAAIRRLTERDLKFDAKYTFRRYVDDVFIFAEDEKTAHTVYEIYADELMNFNLSANKAKSTISPRPFATQKSRLIHAASNASNEFISKFLEVSPDNSHVTPKQVHSTWKLARSFIQTVKMLCAENGAGYDEVASFLISVFAERAKKLVSQKVPALDAAVSLDYRNACLVLLETLFFLYSVAPSVASSYKMSTALILLTRFVREELPDHAATIIQRAYELVEECLRTRDMDELGGNIRDYLALETINLVLAAKELGEEHLLPEQKLVELFGPSEQYCYFRVISCLFYVGALTSRYPNFHAAGVKAALRILRDLSDIEVDSEKAYLLLDVLCCPHVDLVHRKHLLASFFSATNVALPSPPEIAAFLAAGRSWQVKWGEIDLLNSLEKKELKQVY